MKKIITILMMLMMVCGCTTTTSQTGEKTAPIKKETTNFYFLTDENGDVVLDEEGIPLTPLNTNVWITTTNEKLKDQMANDFYSLVRKYHYLFDSHHNFDGINNIKTINDNYDLGPVKVDSEIIEILKEAIEISKLTDGYFNPTIGSLSNVWSHLYNKQAGHKDPDPELINKAKACVISPNELEEYVLIDEINKTVELKKYDACSSSVNLSLGAISKGYVLDKAYDELLKYDSGFLISAGGSSTITYIADDQMDNLKWRIGITDPNNPSNIYTIMDLKTSFISTSGDYQQFFINDEGVLRHHILNPYTGYPENYYRSITLVANKGGAILDAMSTSMYSSLDFEKYIVSLDEAYDLDVKTYILTGDEDKLETIYNTMGEIILEY